MVFFSFFIYAYYVSTHHCYMSSTEKKNDQGLNVVEKAFMKYGVIGSTLKEV